MTAYDPDKHCGGQRLNQPPGVLCTRPKGWGTDHPGIGRCKRHGGSTRNHNRSAAVEQVRRTVTELGLSQGMGQIDPRDALELELWRTHVQVMLYQSLVDELALEEGGIYAKTYHVSGRLTGEAKPHVLVVMRDDERDRLARVAVAAAKAGVEDRRITLEEQRGQLIYAMLRAVFTELDVPLDRALPVAARHLRLLASGEQKAA